MKRLAKRTSKLSLSEIKAIQEGGLDAYLPVESLDEDFGSAQRQSELGLARRWRGVEEELLDAMDLSIERDRAQADYRVTKVRGEGLRIWRRLRTLGGRDTAPKTGAPGLRNPRGRVFSAVKQRWVKAGRRNCPDSVASGTVALH